MITKLTGQLAKDIVEFLNKYGILITAQYTPELPGVISYSRNFLSRTIGITPVNLDGKLYQNKLLYRVSTPKLAEHSPQNQSLSILSGFESCGQEYVIESTTSSISKIRTSADVSGSSLVKLRDVTIMDIELEFCIITESIDLVFAISTLFYQKLVNQNVLTLDLDLFNDDVLVSVPYFMNWDRDSLEIGYANFEANNTLNTISFKIKLSGAVFSEFFVEDHIIKRYDLTIGFIKEIKEDSI